MSENFSLNPWIEKKVDKLSLSNILLMAFVARLIAAIFSKGYGMYDDHFYVIEVAQSWVDGKNIGSWLPNVPQGVFPDVTHSLFYPGIHFILFSLMKILGLNDPQLKMLVIRILHAFYSLLTVYFGYKITEQVSNTKTAKWVAIFLSLIWFLPNLSIRNLVEVVCIPPLLAGTYLLMINTNKRNWKKYLLSGFVIGFAFSIRYQTALIIGGIGLVLLFQSEFKGFIIYSLGVLINVILFQCIVDIYLWGYPLAEFWGYIQYNLLHKDDFITGHWFNYCLLITGLVLPPFSIIFWFGYFKNIRERLLLFLPSFIFLVFHSCFENKQERFILTFIPYFIILGFAGWGNIVSNFFAPEKRRNAFQKIVSVVIILNLVLLITVSVASSKTSRMDSMYYLYKRGNCAAYIIEQSYTDSWQFFPRFYLGKWCDEYFVTKQYSAEQLKNNLKPTISCPNYVIFLSEMNLKSRIETFKKVYPNIEFCTAIEPSIIDQVFHKLNPVNKNEPCFIYKINNSFN